MGRRITAAALAVLGAATTRVVDQAAGPYTTIGDALLAAAPGDTVDIHRATDRAGNVAAGVLHFTVT